MPTNLLGTRHPDPVSDSDICRALVVYVPGRWVLVRGMQLTKCT